MNIIEFPGLGLKLDINPVAFSIGKISVYWYGIIIASALLLAVLLAMKDSERFGIPQEKIIDVVLFAAPVAIIFARLYFVIFKWEDYRGNIKEIINIRSGGLAIYGGIIGGLLVAYIYAKVTKIGVLKLFDYAVPYLALAQGIGRWGNFINQEAFGVNTTLPWGMTSERIRDNLLDLQMQGVSVIPDIPVHPTFLYESLWDLFIFAFLIFYRKRRKGTGEVFYLYLVLYGLGRAFIEGLRTDSLMLGNLRISQVLSVLLAVAFAVIFFISRKRKIEADMENAALAGTSEYGEVLKQLNVDAEEEAGEENVDEEVSEDAAGEEKVHEEDTVEKMEASDVHHEAGDETDEPIKERTGNVETGNDSSMNGQQSREKIENKE